MESGASGIRRIWVFLALTFLLTILSSIACFGQQIIELKLKEDFLSWRFAPQYASPMLPTTNDELIFRFKPELNNDISLYYPKEIRVKREKGLNYEESKLPFKELMAHERKFHEIINYWKSKSPNYLKTQIELGKNGLWLISRVLELNYEQDGSSNKGTILVADVHGDLNVMLAPLILNGFVKIDQERPYVLYDTRNFKRLNPSRPDTIEDYRQNLFKNGIIKIPNLILNPDSDLKIQFLGDMIDRGEFTIEVFCVMEDIIQQERNFLKLKPQANTRINFLLGNHEVWLANGFIKYFYEYSKNIDAKGSRFFSLKVDALDLGSEIKRMYEGNEIKVANTMDGIFYAHAYLARNYFIKFIADNANSNYFKLLKSLMEFFLNLDKPLVHDATYLSNLEQLVEQLNKISLADLENQKIDNKDLSFISIRPNYYGSKIDPKDKMAPLLSIQMASGHQSLGDQSHPVFMGSSYNVSFDLISSSPFNDGKSKPIFYKMYHSGSVYQYQINPHIWKNSKKLDSVFFNSYTK